MGNFQQFFQRDGEEKITKLFMLTILVEKFYFAYFMNIFSDVLWDILLGRYCNKWGFFWDALSLELKIFD
jgi:hypothetical protein